MTLERIEERRDRVVGLDYEAHLERGDVRFDWKYDVLTRDGDCIVDHDCEGDLQAHHVVTQQHLRKRGLGDYAWDPRIGVAVCELAHRRHHSARERISVNALPREVVTYVNSLGMGWYLERYYAPEDAA